MKNNRCPPLAVDNRKCRVCDCAMRPEATSSSHACTPTPKNCPSKWWMNESADTHETNKENGALSISSDTYRKCNDMCMLPRNDGYTLSTTTDETGCQTCACVDSEPCRIIT
ncbi:uncharacterized protein LOC127877054 [Dreissena polymorpha]|uniref:uncharacterized protein LOC127877054 n=1 Tax=Dreissena polymorpha TaxID=45954 RepID=UPI00226403EF|nr:uncharacterized protein LOC127877054 [Dreissena polymorpha]